jgi:hypothetical protein
MIRVLRMQRRYRRKAMWSFPGIWDPATSNATMRKASSIILSFRNSTHHNALHAACQVTNVRTCRMHLAPLMLLSS